jgi:ribosomal protein S18 acetylase RimI-like enzyme
MQIISAVNVPLSNILASVTDAYSDYFVPMQMDLRTFEKMLGMRGFDSSLSMLAVEEDASGATDIASFWLSAIEPEARPGIVYAITVGTCIAHRRKGLAQQLYKRLAPRAREAQLNSCLLEVIEGNDKAVDFYEGLGFKHQMRVECFKGAAPTHESMNASIRKNIRFQTVSVEESHAAGNRFREWQPTWQHDTPAMAYISDDIQCSIAVQNGLPIAYGMVDPISGLVTQIAVDPKWRRKGIAKAMMAYWAQKFDLSAMSAGNIPDTDKDTCGFYRALGWENHVNQFVMQAKL